MRPWKVIGRRDLLSLPGRVEVAMETVELPDGRRIDDYVQLHVTNFVLVFAETADRRVVCLRQYRHAVRGPSLELVAGRIDAGEDPLAAAQRELLEESGYQSAQWEELGTYVVSPTQGIGRGYAFHARNATRVREPNSGDLEEALVELLARDALIAAMRKGEIASASHLAALALALLR